MITSIATPGTSLHNGSLLLTPIDADARPSIAELEQQLRRAGLVDAPLSAGSHRYGSGARFFDLVAFTGCAVQLNTSPDASDGLQVRFEGPFDTPQLRSGRNSRPPRCPHCQRPLSEWRDDYSRVAAADAAVGERLRCRSCGASSAVWTWQWGRHAGAGSIFVNIEPVFPGEGQPLPPLFEALDLLEVGPWRHFYVQR